MFLFRDRYFLFLSLHFPNNDILILFYLKFCSKNSKMKKRNKTTPPQSRGQILLPLQRLEPVLRSLSEWHPTDFSYRAKLTDGLTEISLTVAKIITIYRTLVKIVVEPSTFETFWTWGFNHEAERSPHTTHHTLLHATIHTSQHTLVS